MLISLPIPEYKYLEDVTKEKEQQWKQKHAEDIKKGIYKECPFFKRKEDSPIEIIAGMKKFDDMHCLGVTGHSFTINPEIYDRLKDK